MKYSYGCAWSEMNKHGTHRANSFLTLNISWSIWPTHSFEIPSVSVSACNFNLWSAYTRHWTFVTLPFVVAVLGGNLGVVHKNQHWTTLKLVKPIFESHHRKSSINVKSPHFNARLTFHKQELTYRPTLFFSIFQTGCVGPNQLKIILTSHRTPFSIPSDSFTI